MKVVIASGYSKSEHRAGLIQSGAKGFVGKPYEAKKLLDTIREVLDEVSCEGGQSYRIKD